jgi:hypothetical protein
VRPTATSCAYPSVLAGVSPSPRASRVTVTLTHRFKLWPFAAFASQPTYCFVPNMHLSSMKYSGTSVLASRQAVSSAIGTSRASSISRPCLTVGRLVAAKGSKFAPARELAVCAKRYASLPSPNQDAPKGEYVENVLRCPSAYGLSGSRDRGFPGCLDRNEAGVLCPFDSCSPITAFLLTLFQFSVFLPWQSFSCTFSLKEEFFLVREVVCQSIVRTWRAQ